MEEDMAEDRHLWHLGMDRQSLDGKMDESQVDERNEDVERYGNTTILLFSRKVHGILHQEIRGQVNTIVMEQFNSNLFQESGPAKKQHMQ
jgi:hypothetical protein